MNDDLMSLQPVSAVSRRGFVVTALATGFALAVRPVAAETITTPAEVKSVSFSPDSARLVVASKFGDSLMREAQEHWLDLVAVVQLEP